MKKNYGILVFCLCSIMLTIDAFANAPKKCPNINAIKNIKFNYVRHLPDCSYLVMRWPQKYDSDISWVVNVDVIKSNSFDDAVNKAQNSLTSLSLDHGPIKIDENNWKCVYRSDTNLPIEASTYLQ